MKKMKKTMKNYKIQQKGELTDHLSMLMIELIQKSFITHHLFSYLFIKFQSIFSINFHFLEVICLKQGAFSS